MRFRITYLIVLLCVMPAFAQNPPAALTTDLSNIYRVSEAKSFSVGPENLTGEKAKGGMAVHGSAANAAWELGQGWKENPFVIIQPGTTFTLAEIKGPGAIQHIWMTPTGEWRLSILRMYWTTKPTHPSKFRLVISSRWDGENTRIFRRSSYV